MRGIGLSRTWARSRSDWGGSGRSGRKARPHRKRFAVSRVLTRIGRACSLRQVHVVLLGLANDRLLAIATHGAVDRPALPGARVADNGKIMRPAPDPILGHGP